MSVGYFQVAQSEGDERRHRYRARYLYVVVAALAVILAGGWFLTQSLGNLAWQQVRKGSLAHNQLAIQRLTFEIQEAEEAVRAMSGSPWIAPALRVGVPPDPGPGQLGAGPVSTTLRGRGRLPYGCLRHHHRLLQPGRPG